MSEPEIAHPFLLVTVQANVLYPEKAEPVAIIAPEILADAHQVSAKRKDPARHPSPAG